MSRPARPSEKSQVEGHRNRFAFGNSRTKRPDSPLALQYIATKPQRGTKIDRPPRNCPSQRPRSTLLAHPWTSLGGDPFPDPVPYSGLLYLPRQLNPSPTTSTLLARPVLPFHSPVPLRIQIPSAGLRTYHNTRHHFRPPVRYPKQFILLLDSLKHHPPITIRPLTRRDWTLNTCSRPGRVRYLSATTALQSQSSINPPATALQLQLACTPTCTQQPTTSAAVTLVSALTAVTASPSSSTSSHETPKRPSGASVDLAILSFTLLLPTIVLHLPIQFSYQSFLPARTPRFPSKHPV
ncbi:hypothetical protein QR685DRAFT_587905 [Neurospora intermedia]|uniref:Uncharacterized protein n=1 Tax=Neurospora intermedia TaxID=5142 RepID=A0ABR3DEN8_NEUIN